MLLVPDVGAPGRVMTADTIVTEVCKIEACFRFGCHGRRQLAAVLVKTVRAKGPFR